MVQKVLFATITVDTSPRIPAEPYIAATSGEGTRAAPRGTALAPMQVTQV